MTRRKRLLATRSKPTAHAWEEHLTAIFNQPETWTAPKSVKVTYSARTSIGVYRGEFLCPDGERPTVIVRVRVVGGLDRPQRFELISREVRIMKIFRRGKAA